MKNHREIGEEQELFMFSEESPGNRFFLPNGLHIINELRKYLREEYRLRGYQEVSTPIIYNTNLWKKSGHWDKYQENMYKLDIKDEENKLDIKDEEIALKPMNCPAHCLIFKQKLRSYRDLPMRLADFGTLHRNEVSGSLTGLTRVRSFHQDDAHIFCQFAQIKDEIMNSLKFMESVYHRFGFTFDMELSTRPKLFIGELEQWEQAEKILKEVLNEFGHSWKINEGDGAFYGPKIDIHLTDSLGRTHQCATVQLDFNLPLPHRLDLKYCCPKDNQFEMPVIIHRAIFGSFERFFAILCEHYQGKWPFWLSPRQFVIIPVSKEFIPYAEKVKDQLFAKGYNIVVDSSPLTLNKKIRNAEVEQYNYILVVGRTEMINNSVNVRERDNPEQYQLLVEIFMNKL